MILLNQCFEKQYLGICSYYNLYLYLHFLMISSANEKESYNKKEDNNKKVIE